MLKTVFKYLSASPLAQFSAGVLTLGLAGMMLVNFLPVEAANELPAQFKPGSPCETVLLEFYWDKCGACKDMAPTVDGIETSLGAMGLKVKRLEVYDPANTALNNTFHVKAVPAFFLFGGDGTEIGTFPAGTVTKEQLPQAIKDKVKAYKATKKCG